MFCSLRLKNRRSSLVLRNKRLPIGHVQFGELKEPDPDPLSPLHEVQYEGSDEQAEHLLSQDKTNCRFRKVNKNFIISIIN